MIQGLLALVKFFEGVTQRLRHKGLGRTQMVTILYDNESLDEFDYVSNPTVTSGVICP